MVRAAFLLVLFLAPLPLLADDKPKVDRATLEKRFTELLTGSVLEGSFTIDRMSNRTPPKDKYTITSVGKIKGDDWLIKSRVEYMGFDLEVPVPVKVIWAGETPTIQLTDVSLPGMKGTFCTQLLFDGTRYAGTWSHDKVGGHMWGRVLKGAAKKEAEAKKKEKAESKPFPSKSAGP